MKKEIDVMPALAPVPVVMASCHADGKDNITTVAWTGIVSSDPLLVYISLRPTRYSYEIIQKSKEFVLNIPTKDMAYETDYCGTKSGRQEDKWKKMHFTKEKCKHVKAFGIQECPIQLECKVMEEKALGSHHMFLAKVVGLKVEENLLNEKNQLDFVKADLLAYLGTNYIRSDQVVAKRGICISKK